MQSLHAALTQRNCDTWVDWEDIPLTADWWQEIQRGIECTQTFVFVMSPDSVVSAVCAQEIDHAVRHNKRLVPIVRREGFEMQQVHPALSKRNWLFFRAQDEFEVAFEQLMQTIELDLDYVRSHTRLLERAIEWEDHDRNESFGLRGDDLTAIEHWLTASSQKDPQPTQLQREYIHFSRKVETANQVLLRAGRQARRMQRVGISVLAIGLTRISHQDLKIGVKKPRECNNHKTSSSFIE